MRLDDFDYDLPAELIAQHPLASREDSRLMVLERDTRTVSVGQFSGICRYFRAGDLLVLNDTRVLPARLLGTKETGGRIEVFLVRRLPGEAEVWECLTKCSKPPRPGGKLLLAGGIEGEVLPGGEEPYRRICFQAPDGFLVALERAGRMPLPPYIRRDDDQLDRSRYQTVFADKLGAVAAPTAGLHFTEAILSQLQELGVEIRMLTLHVGLGTFLPVRVDDVRSHRMHAENYEISADTAEAINLAKADGRRVLAVGTTTTRTLEYAVDSAGRVVPGEGVTDLFIYPGFRFQVVDALVTNFHLPRSTLLMLVSAMAGRDFTLAAYRQAVAQRFRFFSYGDCMLIL